MVSLLLKGENDIKCKIDIDFLRMYVHIFLRNFAKNLFTINQFRS